MRPLMKMFWVALGGAWVLGVGGCGDGSNTAEAGGSTGAETAPGTSAADNTSSGAATSSESSSSDADGSTSAGGSESGDETSSGGSQEPECPEDVWPRDGSEVKGDIEALYVGSWSLWSGGPEYASSLSKDAPDGQKVSISLRSDTAAREAFATVSGVTSATAFAGERIRLRAWVKRIEVERHAGLWLRVDDVVNTLVLDNGVSSPGYGTSDGWQLEELVVDVPEGATSMSFGGLLLERGELLVSGAELMVVSDDVPTTQPNLRRPAQAVECLGDLGPFAEELVHVIRTEAWPDAEVPVLEEFSRDDDELLGGVPTFRVDGAVSGFVGALFHWPASVAQTRIRATLPLRARELSGEIRLRIIAVRPDGTSYSHVSEPLEVSENWQEYTVVAELPAYTPNYAEVGIQAEADGTLWAGQGVVERVTDDVPLSELLPE